jgi:hypothetical protein
MFAMKKTTVFLWCCLATLLTSQVSLSNAAATVPEGSAEGVPVATNNQQPPVSNAEFTDFLASMWKFFQNVQNTNGQQASSDCASNNQNIICSILVKESSSSTVLIAQDFTQPMTSEQCAQQCTQSTQPCVAYETTNITTSVRTVYPVSGSNVLTGGQCNCPPVQTNCGGGLENQELATTTPTTQSTTSTPATPTTTPTTTTPTTTRTYSATDKGVALSATSSQSFSQQGGTIPLNAQTDLNSHFSNNHFSAAAGGLHFVEVCAGVQAGTPVNVRVQGSSNLQVGMTWDAKIQNGVESPCRSGLTQVAPGGSLSAVLDSGVAYSDAGNYNSLTVLSLSETLNDQALQALAYATANNSPPLVNNTITPIPMQTIITPTAANFDGNTASYTCGVTGPHVVSVSIGVLPNTPTLVQITNDDINVGLTRTSVKFDGTTTQSRNVIINCAAGSKIQLNLVSGTVVDSDNTNMYNLTTFSVFPYLPRNVASPVSWGLYKSYIAYNNEAISRGDIDPFYFTNVTVNQGSAYDFNSRVLTVPSSGYYFTCVTCGAGVGKNGANFTFTLKKNSDTLIQLQHQSTSEGATDMFGRCAVVKLNANDQLRCVGVDNSYFYSSLSGYEISWVGFKVADLQN